MLLLYKGVCVPLLFYTSCAFYERTTNSHLGRVLLPSQRSFLLLVVKACRTVSTEVLQVLAGVLPANLQIVKAALDYCVRRGDAAQWGDFVVDAFAEGGFSVEKGKMEEH